MTFATHSVYTVDPYPSEAPPAYQEEWQTNIEKAVVPVTSAHAQKNEPFPRETRELPCVIPQTSKSFKGAFFSPFARAWAPQLASYGITRDDFLAMIDGLNTVFINHPAFEALGLAGNIMGMCHGFSPVQWAGMGLQLASGVASAATSYLRTRAYVKDINEKLFHPAGLHLEIKSTKEMMAKIGSSTLEIQLPSLDALDEADEAAMADSLDGEYGTREDIASRRRYDPRMRRMEAIQGLVMDLDFNVPAAKLPENIVNRISAKYAQKKAEKQGRKAEKKWNEAQEKAQEKYDEAEEERSKGDRKIAEKQREAERELAKLERKLASEDRPRKREKAERDYEKERAKIMRDVDREIRKRDKDFADNIKDGRKELEKSRRSEHKTANKIRWLVLAKWEGESAGNDMSSDDDRM